MFEQHWMTSYSLSLTVLTNCFGCFPVTTSTNFANNNFAFSFPKKTGLRKSFFFARKSKEWKLIPFIIKAWMIWFQCRIISSHQLPKDQLGLRDYCPFTRRTSKCCCWWRRWSGKVIGGSLTRGDTFQLSWSCRLRNHFLTLLHLLSLPFQFYWLRELVRD